MERVIRFRNISNLRTPLILITTTGPFSSTHAIWIRVITKGSAGKSVDPAAGFMSKYTLGPALRIQGFWLCPHS